MVKIDCDGCGAPYEIDARRIPPTGLTMRCPKCGKSMRVTSGDLEADLEADLDVDLPIIHPSGAPRGAATRDLPVARAPSSPAFGELDLGVDLPAVYPSPTQAMAPAADLFDEDDGLEIDDLPVIRGGSMSPDFGGFGEIDLPIIHGAGPARPAMGSSPLGFGEIDLPIATAGLPLPAQTSLPSPLTSPRAPAQTSLPTPLSSLPTPAQPSLPTPLSSLPTPAQPSLPTPLSSLPATAFTAASASERPAGLLSDDFQFELADISPPSPEPLAPEPQPLAEEEVGVELEIGAGPASSLGPAFAPVHIAHVAEPLVELAPRRSLARPLLVGALALVLVAGGALAFVPGVGAFGYLAISDRLQASSHEQALVALEQRSQASLAEDTWSAAASAVDAARAAHEDAIRYKPITGYAAYINYATSLRFGRQASSEATAAQWLTEATPEASGPTFTLARAAQDAVSGHFARARQQLAPLVGSDPMAAALAAEIELSAKDDVQALKAWNHAITLSKSAKTLYGLARAQLAAGDLKAAEVSARATLAASPKHVGARTMLAKIMLSDQAKEAEVLELLAAATEDKRNASEVELVAAYTALGQLHLARSRVSAADQAFAAALKLNPQALDALLGHGELYYRAGRFAEALSRFDAAVRADSDSVLAKVGVAKVWLAQERVKEAQEVLKKLRDAKPKSALIAYWLGRADEALGHRKEADDGFLAAIELGGDSAEVIDAFVALSRSLAAQGRPDEAAAKLTLASERFPESAALGRARGEVALDSGRYADAKVDFERALAKGEDLNTRFLLGTTLRRMREFDAAETTFNLIDAADKDFPGLALERGLLYEQMGDEEKALSLYADALKKAPNDLDLKLRVGSTQLIAGHAKQAEPVLREVWQERPQSAEANYYLGRSLLAQGTNLTEAVADLNRATELDPNAAEYWLYAGWAAKDVGQPARAKICLDKAIELDHNLGDAYWQRGVLLQSQGQTTDALANLLMALAKNPSRTEAYATIALSYQDQSNWAGAEDAWRRAIAGNDKVADWHYRLGRILAQRGDRAGSVDELEKAVTLGESVESPRPAWLFDAHFLLGEALRGSNPSKAIVHYRRFLETAPRENAYRVDAERALTSLGANRPL